MRRIEKWDETYRKHNETNLKVSFCPFIDSFCPPCISPCVISRKNRRNTRRRVRDLCNRRNGMISDGRKKYAMSFSLAQKKNTRESERWRFNEKM
jgi:hypothetical protein